MTPLEWRRLMIVGDNAWDFICELHQALGYRPGVYVHPRFMLLTAAAMNRICKRETEQQRAKMLAQLNEIERGEHGR